MYILNLGHMSFVFVFKMFYYILMELDNDDNT